MAQVTNPAVHSNEVFISREQLAVRWGVVTETIKRRERAGVIHPVKLGPRCVRYRLSEVLAHEKEATLDRAVVIPR